MTHNSNEVTCLLASCDEVAKEVLGRSIINFITYFCTKVGTIMKFITVRLANLKADRAIRELYRY